MTSSAPSNCNSPSASTIAYGNSHTARDGIYVDMMCAADIPAGVGESSLRPFTKARRIQTLVTAANQYNFKPKINELNTHTMFAIIPPLFVLFVFTFYHFHPKYLLFRPRSDFEKKKRANQTGTTSQSQPPQHRQKTPLQEQIDADKSLYHALQNAQDFPEALPVGRKRLLELLDHTINLTLLTPDKSSTILSIPSFSSESLKDFLQSAEDATSAKFDAYLHRRKHGGGREMFPDREYAEYWVRQSAPVKYVDGAWLGGVHRVDTLPKDRRWSKTAWQILSEELGDGDLEKNHIAVYEKLLNSICDIGRGDERRFIDPAVNPNNDARVWTAAVAQLFVSLYADEFLPEILGFNMAYESLPYHLLLVSDPGFILHAVGLIIV
jgi:hypothetical protein